MNERFNENCTARADMLALLNICLRVPDEDLIGGLSDGSLLVDFSAVTSELGYENKIFAEAFACMKEAVDSEDLLRRVRIEYTRLFIGPESPAVSPYEGVFNIIENHKLTQPTLFIGRTAVAVEKHYKDAGFARSKDYRESPDSIGTELFFLRELEVRALQAEHRGDASAKEEAMSALSAFVVEHFGIWAPEFFRKVQQHGCGNFYAGIGAVGERFSTDYCAWVASVRRDG